MHVSRYKIQVSYHVIQLWFPIMNNSLASGLMSSNLLFDPVFAVENQGNMEILIILCV